MQLLIDYVPKGIERQRMPLSDVVFYCTKYGTYTSLSAAKKSLPNITAFIGKIHENFFLLSVHCKFRSFEGRCNHRSDKPDCRVYNCPLLIWNDYDKSDSS